MADYSKKIECLMGIVYAAVYRGDERVQYAFFEFPFSSLESRMKKAHKWADKLIVTLKKYEVTP